ncbi:YraN family protein [Microgenomates group bacterium]|nr:YraN family protein [Microgenomates group bacterium]
MPAELKRRILSKKQKKRHNFSLGKTGEELAERFLLAKGYKLVAKNYRTGKGRGGGEEIDLIFLEGKEVVFVEVKTRTGENYGSPALAVNKTKVKQLSQAVNYFLRQNPRFGGKNYRIDAVSVALKEDGTVKIDHYQNITWLY